MNQRYLLPAMLLVGIVLIGVGYQWNRLRPPSAYWDEKQAAELTAAQVHLHELSHEHPKGSDAAHSPDFIAAKERLANISRQLDDARSSRSRTGTLLMVAGMTSIASAAILHLRHTKAPN